MVVAELQEHRATGIAIGGATCSLPNGVLHSDATGRELLLCGHCHARVRHVRDGREIAKRQIKLIAVRTARDADGDGPPRRLARSAGSARSSASSSAGGGSSSSGGLGREMNSPRWSKWEGSYIKASVRAQQFRFKSGPSNRLRGGGGGGGGGMEAPDKRRTVSLAAGPHDVQSRPPPVLARGPRQRWALESLPPPCKLNALDKQPPPPARTPLLPLRLLIRATSSGRGEPPG